MLTHRQRTGESAIQPAMNNNVYYRVIAMVMVYAILKFFGGSFGSLVLYPITLLVTFLHEFGHALGGLLTGAHIDGMQINPDGSGYTVTRGGHPAIILMGGYLGSVMLGNLLFYIGVRKSAMTQTTLYVLAALMVLAGVVWFESFVSTGLLLGFAATLALIAWRTNWDQDVLIFLGVAAILYIIQDFNVGPKSDLNMYQQVVGIFPSGVWMYIWLGIAAMVSYTNVRAVLKR
jgi:hypothetical protein